MARPGSVGDEMKMFGPSLDSNQGSLNLQTSALTTELLEPVVILVHCVFVGKGRWGSSPQVGQNSVYFWQYTQI